MRMQMVGLLGALALSLGAASLTGCVKPKLIPNTKIKDTDANREVLKVVVQYQRAMEERDAPKVLSLVHPTYQDNAGTPEATDDRDYEGVKKLLAMHLRQTSKVRYRIEFLDLRISNNEADVYAYIDATFVYEPGGGALPRWRRMADHHRFHLVKEGSRWLFASGL
jgi:hypothetical protein